MTILFHIFWVTSFIAATAATMLGAVLGAGILYQCIGSLLDRRSLLKPGRMVDIGGGRRLYLMEKGPAGRGPAVVFEAGFGATSLNWMHIQEAMADEVHTVAYDRCGLGWSSACVSERTPSNIAGELRAMLRAAGIEPPWILVGHSFGGLVMQRFALDYPDDTAAVILIDPMRTDEWPPVNQEAHARIARAQRLTRVGATCARIGMSRLVARSHFCRSARLSGFLIQRAGAQGAYLAGRLNTEIGKMPAQVRPAIAAHWSAPGFYHGLLAHLHGVSGTVLEMHEAEPIGETPVVVLTPASAPPPSNLHQYGRRSRHIVAERSLHWIHLDEPDLVVRTILNTVIQAVAEDKKLQPVLAGAD
ncbi:MAG TPA: alpha/beta fold hydrolase [Acidobacteriaceae bacterium]|nr:alpha/beta fold hydrolase [Acidobacteriaceae bacterium]